MFQYEKLLCNMHSRSIIVHLNLSKGCCLRVFKSGLKTEGSKKNGKLCATKRKFTSCDGSFETLQSKDSSSFIKQYNTENKHLFGDIIDVFHSSFSSLPKNQKKHAHKKSAEIVNSLYTIPIEDVTSKEFSDTSNDDNISSSNYEINLHNSDINDILSFPLINKICSSSEDEYKRSVERWNSLRQKILLKCEKLPSITSILEKTMPPERVAILTKWKASKIEQMGEENFKQYQKDLFANGSSLHEHINQYLTGVSKDNLQINPSNSGHWSSLKNFLPAVREAKLLEEGIEHPFLGYCGVVDCFAIYKKNFVVIDWKTSEKAKTKISQTYDAPLQVAAYAGALNFDPRFNYKADKGLIAVAYQNGDPASIHYLDEVALYKYWELWLKRLKSYWEKKIAE